MVAFDPFTTSFSEPDCHDFSGSDDESQQTVISRNTYERNFTKTLPNRNSTGSECQNNSRVSASAVGTCYRLGSVSQDTQLCLWDITEDVLRQPLCLNKNRTSVLGSGNFSGSGNFITGNGHKIGDGGSAATSVEPTPISTNQPNKPPLKISNKVGLKSDNKINNVSVNHSKSNNINISLTNSVSPTNSKENYEQSSEQIVNNHGSPSVCVSSTVTTVNSFTQRLTTGLGFGDKKSDSSHKRNFSLGSKVVSSSTAANDNIKSNTVTLRTKTSSVSDNSNNKRDCDKLTSNNLTDRSMCDPLRLIGTPSCPRFDECPVLEPLICKKISQERLTTLVFREDCFVTACQEGIVYTWARPGKVVS